MSARTNLDLLERSMQVILDNQHSGGAFLACPTMPDYQFSWFRDGAYIVYALTIDGKQVGAQYNGSMAAQWEAGFRFHSWCANQVLSRETALERVIASIASNGNFDRRDVLNARYRVTGLEGPVDWPEFQLDGPGTWLWSLNEYVKTMGFSPLPAEWESAVTLTARYLATVWKFPCYDCWEEHSDEIHTSTLAAIYAGLKAAQEMVPSLELSNVGEQIKQFVLANCLTPNGELAKSVGRDEVDANLIGAVLPHGLFSPDDPILLRTISRIERELCAEIGGVHRYLKDTYYGGGAWVLLDLHLAWYYIAAGQPEKAAEIVAWVESIADLDGFLPEQVVSTMLAPDYYGSWVEQRGPIANPLLWTHAMYIIVKRELEQQASIS